ncbi:MAG TPA: hypothetical protein PK006_08340 [Saprospiraceae bacterium]|nr:hypothetical protein [Saprospiraceae bacterium]
MEQWQLDFEWLKVRHWIKDRFRKSDLPDLNAILLLIGIQELGMLKEKWTKEEKQDLLHIASCRLLSQEGYYSFKGLDADGWPHYDLLKPFTIKGLKEQEVFLKQQIIQYFKQELGEEE